MGDGPAKSIHPHKCMTCATKEYLTGSKYEENNNNNKNR